MNSTNPDALSSTETPSTALTRRWKIEAHDQNGTSRADDVEAFIQRTGLDTIAPGRFSSLLVLNLFAVSMAARRPLNNARRFPSLPGMGLAPSENPRLARLGQLDPEVQIRLLHQRGSRITDAAATYSSSICSSH
jgi:hypothetical protein